ncbi:MAG: EamA family transporter [Oscillospiraceae bacterium]
MNSKLLIVILIFTLLGSYGSYCFKKVASKDSMRKIIMAPTLYLGGILYLISLLLNIYTLKYMPYNIVFPLTSLTYIWTLMIARIFLKERITYKKILGIGFLCVGAVCMVL